MRQRISIVMAATLLIGSACAAGDLDLVLDEFGASDMSESDDPGVRAAGETVVEVLSAREAEENLTRGIAERDAAAIQQASRLRPDDPRYPLHELALSETGDSPTDAQKALGDRGILLVAAQNPTLGPSGISRVVQETFMTALRDVIRSAPEFEGREAKVTAYCTYITKSYPNTHTEEYPQEVALYLALSADFSLCN